MSPLFSASRQGCFVCSLNAVPVLKFFLVVFVTCLVVDLKFGCVWLSPRFHGQQLGVCKEGPLR